jgi:hypothetical protein
MSDLNFDQLSNNINNSSNIYQTNCVYVTAKENDTVRTLNLKGISNVFCTSNENLIKIIQIYGCSDGQIIHFINTTSFPFFLLCDSNSNMYNFKNQDKNYCKVSIIAFGFWNKNKLEILSY